MVVYVYPIMVSEITTPPVDLMIVNKFNNSVQRWVSYQVCYGLLIRSLIIS